MKAQKFNLKWFCLALVIAGASLGANAQEKTKKIVKEYPVTPATVLNISNKFGKVDVRNWNEQKITVEVVISVEHPQADKAEKILDQIKIEEKKEGDEIYLETVFEKDFGKIGSGTWGSDKKNFSIDYVLQVPAGINLNLINRFGDVFITELTGVVNIDVKFGRLEANKILRGSEKPRSTVTVAHGEGFINEVNWLALNVSYYEMDISRSQALLIESKHSKISVEDGSRIVSVSGYDEFNIGKINNFVGSGAYTSLEIDELTKKLDLDTKYGKCVVKNVPSGFESISIKSAYTQYEIGIDPEATYEITGKASFAKIKVPDKGEVSRNVGNTSMSISGKVGKASSTQSTVNIDTNFGDIILVR